MNRYSGQQAKKPWLELVRIFAAAGVIFNHTDGFYEYYSHTGNPVTFVYSLLGSLLCRMAVPLFLMVSGSLLLQKEESISAIYKKRISRIAIVLLSFSAFYYMMQTVRGKRSIFSPVDFVKNLLAGNIQESLWFLYLYLGILILLPILRKLAVGLTEKEFLYFIGIQCIFCVGLPVFCRITDWSVRSELYCFNSYMFYFLSGHYWENVRKRTDGCFRRDCTTAALLGAAAVGLNFMLIVENAHRTRTFDPSLLDLMIPVTAQSTFVLLCRWGEGHLQEKKRASHLIVLVGGCTFGIYLLEQEARTQLLPFYLFLCNCVPGMIACSCYVAEAFLLALIYTGILKRIPGIRKLL